MTSAPAAAGQAWPRHVLWGAGMALAAVVMAFGLWEAGQAATSTPTGAAETVFGDDWYSLRPGELTALEESGLSQAWYAAFVVARHVFFFAASMVIAVLIWRRTQTWVALYVSLVLVMGNVVVVGIDQTLAFAAVEVLRVAVFALGVVSLLGLLYVFPDGRHARLFLALVGACLGALALGVVVADRDFFWDYSIVVVGGLVLGGVAAQVRRARRAPETRIPVYVLLAAYVVTIASLVLSDLALPSRTGSGFGELIARLAVEGVLLSLPLVIGLAIVWAVTRHGIWDLELAVNRTAVYVALTALLVVVYVAAVAGIQAIVRRVTGIASGNLLGVVAATGLVALLFLPAQRRIQDAIDRVFFRRRYDLNRTLASFSERLRTREQLDAVAGDLLAVADETFQPQAATLVLHRPPGRAT